MEGQTQFQTALKKTVIMFKTFTGKDLSEREASLLINLLDLTEGYQSLITTGTSGMVVSVDQVGNISAAPVTAQQIYSVTEDEPTRPNPLLASAKGSWSMTGEQDAESEALLRRSTTAEVDDYVAQPITTSQRDHIQGYDWQIVVLSREKDPRDSYVVHFAYQPTQEQFEEHFAKFVARTHYVHVNEWDRLHDEWFGVTSHYSNTHVDTGDRNPRWEQADMAYRVRYYDCETGQLTFKYMQRKPSGIELAKYHHTKGFAVVQSKVA